MARYRLALKALEIVVSVAFFVLCAEAFCSHFYNDMRRRTRSRRTKIAALHSRRAEEGLRIVHAIERDSTSRTDIITSFG
jgi:hypothetical protein